MSIPPRAPPNLKTSAPRCVSPPTPPNPCKGDAQANCRENGAQLNAARRVGTRDGGERKAS
eukprot:6094980-Pyramimonas_sp.AAC.1